MYAALQVLSNLSFLQGASHPEELVRQAAQLGLPAMALTDDCSLAGVVRAHQQAKKHPAMQLLIGACFDVQANPGGALMQRRAPDEVQPGLDAGLHMAESPVGALFRLLLVAPDREAYAALSQFITDLRCKAPKGRYHLAWRDIQPALLKGLLVIALPSRRAQDAELLGLGRWLLAHFAGSAWLGVDLPFQLDDTRWVQRLQWLSEQTELPLVAAPQVLLHHAERKALHDVLTATRVGLPLDRCGYLLAASASAHLQRPDARYDPEWLAQTLRIAERCHFSLDELRYEYPSEVVPAGLTPTAHLRALTWTGCQRRWPEGVPPQVRRQLEQELALIAELQYEHYFLTVADLVDFARQHGILCQGRGSAANSAVCYALGITEVDPSRAELLFERFISRERREPPDIDVDFEHQRREEVIQYLYAKYGRRRAGLTAVVIRYRPRSALRDVGKALGFEPALIDRIAKDHSWWDDRLDGNERLRALGLDPEDRRLQRLFQLATELLDTPRHLSQHVGGFVLTQGPLSRLVPIENATMPGRTVVQWDKDDLDALGLLKVDVLALGMLSCIRRALDLLSVKQGRRFAMQDIPHEDAATYEMLCRADAVGTFQVESRAQMSMLPRLQPRRFYDLVIEVAIVRPGPIQGGMVHPYLRRRQGLEKVDYPSEDLRRVLERTEGVPIFQEQVMQIAVIAAGFTPGEADQVRRGMAAWKRHGNLSQFQERLFQGMRERGYTQAFAEQLYQQILGFAEYGFPESHAASFALLTYASSWLKCHHPAEFLCALLNSQPLGFYTPSALVQDARRHSVRVQPPCVNASFWESHVEAPDTVRLGLHLVKGLKEDAARRVVAAREGAQSERASRTPPGEAHNPWTEGPYAPPDTARRLFDSAEQLQRRAQLERSDLEQLAAADALMSLSGQRRQQLWEAAALLRAPPLLQDAPVAEEPLELPEAPEPEEVVWDYANLGLTLRSHPLALLRRRLQPLGFMSGEQLARLGDRRLARTVGLVTVRQQPGTAQGVTFVSLEDEFGTHQVVVWKKVRERFRSALLHARLLAVWGVWQREPTGKDRDQVVCNLIAHRLEDLTPWLGELGQSGPRSRDFR
ncbi:error-prone DNA polymerase [Inhella sp.]|uniref:error-prone DNA polymerase n=1 Tax=Inhella sp. TaxID=1921806 RepID=UPI0035B2A7B0